MAKNRRIILLALSVLAAIAVLAMLYAAFFGVQTTALLLLKKPRDEYPEVYRVPQHLEARSAPEFAGRKLSYFGYEFEAPWTDIEKENLRRSFARASFKSGKEIIVFNPAEAVDLLDELRKKHPEHADRMESLFGHNSVRSNYALYRSILNVTPNDLSIFMAKRDAVRLAILLILKRLLMVNSGSGLYSFEYRYSRGFQFGDPARTDKVIVHVFDEHDRKLELLLFVTKGAAATLSQNEITHVIRTLRPAA